MKAKISDYVKFAAVAILTAGSGIVQAQSVPCTISGGPGVYACADGDSPHVIHPTPLITLGINLFTLFLDKPAHLSLPVQAMSSGMGVQMFCNCPDLA